jgi:putative transposase
MNRSSTRILAPAGKAAAYHLVSRVVDRRLVLGEAEREKFVALTKALATFCGVDVYSWCIMGNHFHLLAEIQPGDPAALPDDAFLARLRALWSPARMREFQAFWDKAASPDARRALRAPHEKLMGSLPAFMQALKQRFTVWFNRKHERAGTLWESRYKSVIVDPEPSVLRVLAAYIDLNPVRAGLVEDPKDWHWSGYGAAMGGDAWSRRGLANLFKEGGGNQRGEPCGVPLDVVRDRQRGTVGGGQDTGEPPGDRGWKGGGGEDPQRETDDGRGAALPGWLFHTRGRGGSAGVCGRDVHGAAGALPEGRKSGARDLRDIDAGDFCSLRTPRLGVCES